MKAASLANGEAQNWPPECSFAPLANRRVFPGKYPVRQSTPLEYWLGHGRLRPGGNAIAPAGNVCAAKSPRRNAGQRRLDNPLVFLRADSQTCPELAEGESEG